MSIRAAVHDLVNAAYREHGGKGETGSTVLRPDARRPDAQRRMHNARSKTEEVRHPLFDGVSMRMAMEQPQPDPLSLRREAMDAAFEHADEKWREAYEQFILQFLALHGEASAETIRKAYMADKTKPQARKQQASGRLFVKLRHRKQIVAVGREPSKKFGNYLVVYRLAI